MAKVLFQHVTKRFGRTTALDDLNLAIEDGELFAVLGPPKSGKTTLLRCLLGQEDVTEGHIIIGDRDVTELPSADRFAFDLRARFDWSTIPEDLSVYDFVTLELRRRDIPSSEIKYRVYKVAEELGIVTLLNQKIKDLSSRAPSAVGPRDKVEKAWQYLTASVSDVVVIDVDEMFSTFDSSMRRSWLAQRAIEKLEQLRAGINPPIVCTVPHPEQAMVVASRIAILRGGVLQQVDKPENILKNPANDFVANLLRSFSQSEEKE